MSPIAQAVLRQSFLASADEAVLRVLLIEDDPDDVLLLRETLADVQPGGFAWTNIETLAEGIERVAEGSFHIALLDLNLPDSHGLETFLNLRAAAPHLPIVILTGMDDESVGLEAVQRGAQDYLVKGDVDGPVLMRSIRFAVERAHRQEAERALCASQAEVAAAREIQQRLFPAAAPVVAGYDIAGASFPAVEVGGDFFDYIDMCNGCLGLVIGDVSSHGLGPALMMAETRAYLRALMLTRTDVGQILGLANQALCFDTSDGRFVTLLLAGLDPASGDLVYTSAGHPTGYILDSDGNVKHELWSTGIPLGVETDATFPPEPSMHLEPGDLAVFITDGIFEAFQKDGARFGTPRVLDSIRAHRTLPAEQIIRALYADVRAFQSGAQNDDVTAVIIKRLH
jgi:serine phosphatase RsbU (regulator of sigma subunit)